MRYFVAVAASRRSPTAAAVSSIADANENAPARAPHPAIVEQEHVPARAPYRLPEIAVHLAAGQAVEQDDCPVRATTAGQIQRRIQIDAVAREADDRKRGRKLLVPGGSATIAAGTCCASAGAAASSPSPSIVAARLTWVTDSPGGS